MIAFFEQSVAWFLGQPFSVQLSIVAGGSFLCGLVLAFVVLWLFFHRQKNTALARLSEMTDFEKKALEERVAAGLLVAENLRQQCDRVSEERNSQEERLAYLQEKLAQERSDNARLQSRIELDSIHAAEKLELLGEAREQLRLQFAELANSILEEKSANFSKESQEKLSVLMNPLRDQLVSFRQKVDEVHHAETRDRAALQREISSLKDLNQQMSVEAVNLTRALKGDKQIQGSWGELVLERVLEQSALRKGVEYETQVVFRDSKNRLHRPDVIVRLPEGRDIIIDSKVSLVSWEQYVNSEEQDRQEAFLAAHVRAIREHVKGLAAKDYSSLKEVRSLDFVLMFMPVEAAFIAAFRADGKLFSDAVTRKIILVSPTTLLTTLRTVESIWRYEKQSKNAQEIAQRAAALYDKFCSFTDDMARIGKQITSLQGSYDSAMTRLSRGRGNLISKVGHFPQMGVKVKRSLQIKSGE